MKTDDPKFTAHAIGDIEDLTPAERAEIEALIEADPEAAAEDAETRKFAAHLRAELHAEKSEPLTADQRAQVLAATRAEGRAKTRVVIPFSRRSVVLSAIAASLIVGMFVWMIHLMMAADRSARQQAMALNQDSSVLTIPAEPLPVPVSDGFPLLPDILAATPHEPVTKQGAGTFTLSGGTVSMTSPNIDVISTTGQTNAFKVVPAQGVTINTATANAVTSTAGSLNTGMAASGAATSLVTNAGTLSKVGTGTLTVNSLNVGAGSLNQSNLTQGTLQLAGRSTAAGVAGNLPGTMRGGMSIAPMKVPRKPASVAQESVISGDIGFDIVSNYITKGITVENRGLGTRTTTGNISSFDTGIGNFPDAPQPQPERGDTASFDTITDNAFLPVRENPLSTFSTDVDTASYAIVRRFLNEQRLPPKGAVRIEELLNYFTYDYPQPKGDAPFSATMEVAACPWTPAHRLVRIGLKGREIAKDKRPASNLVFLIDVSGSMTPPERLPLLKQSLGLLIDQLGEEDRVAMVVYAGSSGCVLESTSDKAEMRLALGRLEAGGSTNGGSGIQLAYDIARKNFIKGGTNRVILGTDGDWNVGITNHSDLFELITQRAKSGVFLTVLGFGMGNLKDAMLVKLADKGNGNYGYVDSLLEAKKLLVDQIGGTLVTIAKDVKIQVEFNPSQVSGYRLIGYEKRLLAKEDFNDDKKDAGEIGAGHTVTALYEVVPAGRELPQAATVDPLKYQGAAGEKSEGSNQKSVIGNPKSEISPELLTLKLRYKAPDGDTSKLLEFPLTDTGATWEKSSGDFRFAAAVAGYGMLLRDSPHKGNATWNSVHELAVESKGEDANGYRAEFISLLEKAQSISR